MEKSLASSFQARTGWVVLTVVVLSASHVPSHMLEYLLHSLPFHPLNLRLSFLPPLLQLLLPHMILLIWEGSCHEGITQLWNTSLWPPLPFCIHPRHTLDTLSLPLCSKASDPLWVLFPGCTAHNGHYLSQCFGYSWPVQCLNETKYNRTPPKTFLLEGPTLMLCWTLQTPAEL